MYIVDGYYLKLKHKNLLKLLCFLYCRVPLITDAEEEYELLDHSSLTFIVLLYVFLHVRLLATVILHA